MQESEGNLASHLIMLFKLVSLTDSAFTIHNKKPIFIEPRRLTDSELSVDAFGLNDIFEDHVCVSGLA